MKMANHTMGRCPGEDCIGNGHGMFTFAVELVDGKLNGIARFRRTCVDCGASEDFNTRGEIDELSN